MDQSQFPKLHLFVCTNSPDKVGKCGHKKSVELRDKVKELAAQNPAWKGKVRINASGCLGQCEHGIAAVLYPQGKWYLNKQSTDAQFFIEEITKSLS